MQHDIANVKHSKYLNSGGFTLSPVFSSTTAQVLPFLTIHKTTKLKIKTEIQYLPIRTVYICRGSEG